MLPRVSRQVSSRDDATACNCNKHTIDGIPTHLFSNDITNNVEAPAGPKARDRDTIVWAIPFKSPDDLLLGTGFVISIAAHRKLRNSISPECERWINKIEHGGSGSITSRGQECLRSMICYCSIFWSTTRYGRTCKILECRVLVQGQSLLIVENNTLKQLKLDI